MTANLLIGLREGLEASLVVGLLVAALVRAGRRDALPAVAGGVVLAVLLSAGLGAVLELTSRDMTFRQQELFGGSLSILSVGLVTWMVLWMRRVARDLRADLGARVGSALAVGPLAVGLVALLAVGREGLETALFLWAAARATGSGPAPLAGAAVGLAVAAVLGYLVYRGALRIDLRRFFTWSGAALVVVAGGVLAYGVHDLQEAAVLPGLTTLAFDVSGAVPPSSWYGVLLKGTVGFTPATTWLQAVAWLLYVVPMLLVVLRPGGPPRRARAAGPRAVAPAA
ncbi:iron uptake transporter permease EfeU [Pseudokineococcus lusitanus]|uniref:High-affinity iron transporter n=1 Tax=Pseudokineococcus lusitanus TaxID=763993 RepID=A0A3N1HJK2_9ACTN|nr:iron uptake transporter permease EfeU [Pseudokineococcus lusitanus]ROP42737.1 high-affinity iron transporter [Pseudokineococcus lusitanus]